MRLIKTNRTKNLSKSGRIQAPLKEEDSQEIGDQKGAG
jgi:hypothetical protein